MPDNLADLFPVPRDHRDQAWIQRFYAAAPNATLLSFDPQVATGPDYFPYFQMAVPSLARVVPSGPEVSLARVLDHLLDIGCGAVIYGDAACRWNEPEWVFGYGDLLSYRIYGRFDGPRRETGNNPEASTGGHSTVLDHDQEVLVAAPNESYFPSTARRAMGRYMREVYRHPNPGVLLVTVPGLNPPMNLMVNLTAAQYQGDLRKLEAALGRLSWFLPNTYSLIATPESMQSSRFVPLQ
jgi:hypothetical protein